IFGHHSPEPPISQTRIYRTNLVPVPDSRVEFSTSSLPPAPCHNSFIMTGRGVVICCGAVTVAAVFLAVAATPGEELLQRRRNLGKAFYENPTTHAEAIAELKRALDLAPNSLPEK